MMDPAGRAAADARAMEDADAAPFTPVTTRSGVLSNGYWSTWVREAGAGVSWVGASSVTAGGEDGGVRFFLRDRDGGTLAPLSQVRGHATWTPGRYTIEHAADGLDVRIEVCVPPEGLLELRRVTLTNRTARARVVELTAWLEPVLAPAATQASHPAFAKLFVQTAHDRDAGVVFAHRRARGDDERHPWLACAFAGPEPLEFDTDRRRVLGRGGHLAAPRALRDGAPLAGTVGDVLDPVFCLRRAIALAPGATAVRTLALAMAADRGRARATALQATTAADVAALFAAAEISTHARLARLGLDDAAASRANALAAALLDGTPAWRASRDVRRRARPTPARLARHGLAPETPLTLVDARDPAVRACVPALVAAHRWAREQGLPCRMLILAEDPARLPVVSREAADTSVAIVRAGSLPPEDLDAILAEARVVVADADAVARFESPRPATAEARTAPDRIAAPARAGAPAAEEPLEHWNGHGGFALDGSYVVRIGRHADGTLALPPRPWVNVIANEHFGTIVSETGAGATWSRNSRQHRLTPWANDPVLDPHGEALYVRDEDTGAFASPLAGPAPSADGAGYEMRHGFGWSLGRHASDGLHQETLVFVARHDPLKVTRVRIENRSGRPRRLSVFAWQRLVLGASAEADGRHVLAWSDANLRALFARNPGSEEFGGRVAFAACVEVTSRAWRGQVDEAAFLGGGDDAAPAALAHARGLEAPSREQAPCFAQQLGGAIAPGDSVEWTFLLGDAASEDEARETIARWRAPGAVQEGLEAVRAHWEVLTSAVRIETPEPAIDRMVNGWLLYQAVSCRLWGRSALYQSGGAIGFRDQLQDAASLLLVRPDLVRAQLLTHAAQQFLEGDVLHWWHPPGGRGLRTKFADDRLWLPLIAAAYVRATGDAGVLNERLPYLAAPPLAADEAEAYLQPVVTEKSGDLYDHACRAIDASLAVGAHGLPLFGGGDWNDGMNRVGVGGKGESVWMGFFLDAVIAAFLPFAEARGDAARVTRWAAHRAALAAALEQAGWDGAWYRRGYYDDGTPLGSAGESECRIDALAQAWAVLSGVAAPERAAQAMDEVERQLVSERDGIVRLLTPPFRDTRHDPGYIKGYVAGVRENGGQYTHAALWVVQALARLGRNDRAAALLAMLSPVTRAASPEACAVYQVEPYVIAADVYGEPPHVGLGGWTWYTGSAAWMFRVAVESILGVERRGDTLVVQPCIPDAWPACTLRWRVPGGATRYDVRIRNPERRARAVVAGTVDGAPVPIVEGAARVPIASDGATHRVEITLG